MIHMFNNDAVFWKLFLLLPLLHCYFIQLHKLCSWESIVCKTRPSASLEKIAKEVFWFSEEAF